MNIYIIVHNYSTPDLYGDWCSDDEIVAIFGSVDRAKDYLHDALDPNRHEVYNEEMRSFKVGRMMGNVEGEIVYAVRCTDLNHFNEYGEYDDDDFYDDWYILKMEVEE